ncbi:hypothetical protein [Nostoc sp. ChiSLP03a]|nr:hypothetical protein [Nostoc sp. ChiSLP03a]MDZ8216366.1 hypothetical protein [Nostoc sp. ChiSLP03a]
MQSFCSQINRQDQRRVLRSLVRSLCNTFTDEKRLMLYCYVTL